MTTDLPAQTQRFRLTGSQLRLRYIIALTLIAVLTISSQIIIQLSFESQGYVSRVVNIAGRQRMLSQKIAKASSAINNAENPDQLSATREELSAAVTLWNRSHQGLQYGDIELGLPGDNSAEITALFANIAENKQLISTATTTLLDPLADPSSVALAQVQIRENEQDFLTGMNRVVFRYEHEANEKVDLIRRLELILLGITLLILILVALLIFAPAARRIAADMKALLQREEDLEKLFSVSPTAMLLVNPETLSIIRVNQKAHDILLLEFSAGDRCFKEFMDINHPPNVKFLHRLGEASSVNEYEIIVINALNTAMPTLASVRKISIQDEPLLVIGLTDISEIKKAQKVLEHYATTDELTGIMNRRTGLIVLDKLMSQAQRNGKHFVVCFIDIDNLKTINDNFGHKMGDWMISTITQAVNQCVRNGDIFARIGGDEFLIVFPDCNEKQAMDKMAEVRSRLEKIQHIEERHVPLGFSFGAVTYPTERMSGEDTVASLINDADKRMYLDKQIRKNRSASDIPD
tara:strand:+ start:10467 stop:12029 length:1563 start_codon:yes stop_codon:yes gene_type:complete